MNTNFINDLKLKLNSKNIFSFKDISKYQKNITNIFTKEECVKYLNWFKKNYKSLEYFYNLLELENEKEIYLNMILTKLLGINHLSKAKQYKYIHSRDKFDNLLVNNSIKQLQSVTRKLKFYNLSKLGYDIKLYGARALLDKLITQKQYWHKKCHIKKNDYVIDAGACWGDTALLFSLQVGKKGKVFSFDFFEDNLNIFKENLSINKELSNRIILTQKPLYNKSNKNLYISHACADITTLSSTKTNNDQQFKSITIDDFIHKNKIAKIDFIKFDIEGCELNALKGAIKTLKTFKPNLAIASYHNFDDCYKISKFINELNVGYKFYFANYTPKYSDTVIFATTK